MKSKPTIIYLIRHGESEHNRDLIISGHLNPDLTDKGIEHAYQAKQSLKDVSFDAAYSSDLQRAVKTAEIVYGQPVPKDHQLANLRERNYGSVDGKHRSYMDGFRDNQLTMSMSDSWAHKHVPNMESDGEVADRLLSELTRIGQKHPGQTILIGNHGTSMRSLMLRLQNKHPVEEMPIKNFQNGGYLKLAYQNNKFVIKALSGYN